MRSRNGHRGPERRRHPRFPVVTGLIEPISLRFAASRDSKGEKKKPIAPVESQPAILTNLSAGGMSLITFIEPPHAKKFDMDLALPGFSHMPIQGKVVRVHSKGETFNVGIQFTKIQAKHQNRINGMATDHLDCETRISLSLPEACVPKCRFHWLCHKPQKAPHWPPKA